MDRCEQCNAAFVLDSDRRGHTCPPKWRAFVDGDEDPVIVHAYSPHSAAEEACDVIDGEGDFPILDAGGAKVRVEPVGHDRQGGTFDVWAEAEPVYYAREI